jgi:hypothetical protein
MKILFKQGIVGLAMSIMMVPGAQAATTILSGSDRMAGIGDYLQYTFSGLEKVAATNGKLTIKTGLPNADNGFDLDDSGEYLDVVLDDTSLGSYACNDGGAARQIPGATGSANNCYFSLDIDLEDDLLTGFLADGELDLIIFPSDQVDYMLQNCDVVTGSSYSKSGKRGKRNKASKSGKSGCICDDTLYVELMYDTPEISAVPLPAAFPLYGAGLTALGLMGWQRKRKQDQEKA